MNVSGAGSDHDALAAARFGVLSAASTCIRFMREALGIALCVALPRSSKTVCADMPVNDIAASKIAK